MPNTDPFAEYVNPDEQLALLRSQDSSEGNEAANIYDA